MSEPRANKECILLAPCLDSDDWLSIKEYNARVLEHLGRHADRYDIRVCSPPGKALRSRYAKAVVRNLIYPLHVRRLLRNAAAPTVLHVTDQFHAPLLRADRPCVATCHDLIVLKHSALSRGQRARWIRRVRCLRRAHLVFADSRHTALDLQTALGVAPERIVVNYLGVDKAFRRLPQDHRFTAVAERLRQLAETHKLVLHVGSNVVQKNMPTLLRGVGEIRRSGVRVLLVKVGEPLRTGAYEPLVRELALGSSILDLGRIARSELVEVYNCCHAFLFPSLYEGFGLPVLEAQASGLPCVISDASSLPEVGGEAALYHAPDDFAGMASNALRVLNEPQAGDELRNKGMANAGRFTWEAHVECLVRGYRTVGLRTEADAARR